MDTRKILTESIEATAAWVKQVLSEPEPSNVIPFPIERRRTRREK